MTLTTSTLAVIGTHSTSNLNSPLEKKTKQSSKETCEFEATITHNNNYKKLNYRSTTKKRGGCRDQGGWGP